MNIIFTRPLNESEDLLKNFFSSGHNIIHLPTLEIKSKDMRPIDTKDFGSLIFTSANAVRFLKLKNNDKRIKCYCVGSITERSLRQKGFNNTASATGTVNVLKNLILNLEKETKTKNKLAYICGDITSYDLDKELILEGINVEKIVNYSSSKIKDLSNENLSLIKKYPPDIALIYSLRSAESFCEITKKYSLTELMTQCKVMCISKKIKEFLNNKGWNKLEVFLPGEELKNIERLNNGKV
tara:strand:+ start:2564 stop:3283 length:720 start_codon:yes stop_codon:yes gene_type:complete